MGFGPSGVMSSGVMSEWGFVQWGYVRLPLQTPSSQQPTETDVGSDPPLARGTKLTFYKDKQTTTAAASKYHPPRPVNIKAHSLKRPSSNATPSLMTSSTCQHLFVCCWEADGCIQQLATFSVFILLTMLYKVFYLHYGQTTVFIKLRCAHPKHHINSRDRLL